MVLSRDTGYMLLSFGNYTVEIGLALLFVVCRRTVRGSLFRHPPRRAHAHLPQDVRDGNNAAVRDWRSRR